MIADGPFRTPGEFAGFLGKKHDPVWVLKDPSTKDFNVDELKLPTGVSVNQIRDRQRTLAQLGQLSQLADVAAADVRGISDYQARAVDLVTSPAASKSVRSATRTGCHTRPLRPQQVRPKCFAGTPSRRSRRAVCYSLYYSAGIGGWDTHKDNFNTLKNSRLPENDTAIAALLTDLKDRGLLDSTLVYWTGDFGRTPKINSDAGRDHWPPCGTVMMAGGGIVGGREHGKSDATGAYPADQPTTPGDITATLFHAMGFDPRTEIRDQLGRPMPIADGDVIKALL